MTQSVQSLADLQRMEQQGACLPQGVACTYDLLARGARLAPDKPALSFFLRTADHTHPIRWTHRQWLDKVTQAANLFRRLGVQRGDVVAYVLPNLPETHWTIWGAETAGVALALNPLLDGPTLRDLMIAAKARWLVTLAPTPGAAIWQSMATVAEDVPTLQGIIAVSPLVHLPGVAGTALSALSRWRMPRRIGRLPVLHFHREMARERSDRLQFDKPALDEVASFFCTGGTTGLPKIAVRTHRTEVANASQLSATFGPAVAGPDRTVFCGLPLFHVNAQIGTGLAIFGSGGHVLLGTPQGYRAEGLLQAFWSICDRHQVTTFSGVPTVYAALMQTPRQGYRLDSLQFAVCGAAPMPVELFRRFQQETGIKILEGYGLTEAGCVSSLNPPGGESRVGSIGLRMPWQNMKVVHLDEEGRYQREAGVDETGTIVVHGPNLFKGYLSEHHNRNLWVQVADERGAQQAWLNTGDLGRQDADGYFWLTGRAKELIIRGGHNIDPKTIEEAMAGHPAVALCAAVGRPDAYAGEVPVAYVQPRPGLQLREADLLAHAQKHIGERAAQPKAIRVMASLPTTAIGKIFKPALTMMEVESVVREEATRVGIEPLSIAVGQDAKRGVLATVRVHAADAARLNEALGRYTFACEVVSG
jgi:fatty-acyl-CoA synthase